MAGTKGMQNRGKFQPGKSGNPGGRPKGSKNDKFKKLVREKFREAFGIALETLEDDLRKMSPDKRWAVVLKGLRFVMPEHKTEDVKKLKGDIKIQVEYVSPDAQLPESNNDSIPFSNFIEIIPKELPMNDGADKD